MNLNQGQAVREDGKAAFSLLALLGAAYKAASTEQVKPRWLSHRLITDFRVTQEMSGVMKESSTVGC